jgi:hypothetical protein
MLLKVQRIKRVDTTSSMPKPVAIKELKLFKPHSRFKRRWPRNLLANTFDGNSHHPTVKSSRLNTHVWHAKRFVMENVWNFYIPTKNLSRGFKSVHRAFKSNCIVQDVSYTRRIQITSSLLVEEIFVILRTHFLVGSRGNCL